MTALITLFMCEHILRREVDDAYVLYPGFIFLGACTVSYFSSMIFLRTADWSSFQPEASSNNATRSENSDIVAHHIPWKLVATYSCTWPCVALRGIGYTTVIMLASPILTWVVTAEPNLPLLAWNRYNATICWAVATAALIYCVDWVLPSAEWLVNSGEYGWCLAVSISLIWMRIWQTHIKLLGARWRMLNKLYSLRLYSLAFSFASVTWLLFLLRFNASSVDVDGHTLVAASESWVSPRSWTLMFEVFTTDSLGFCLVAWCWSLESVKARHRQKYIAARCVCLWLPIYAWILAMFVFDPRAADAWVSGEDNDAGVPGLHAILAVGCIVCSLAGSLFEVASFKRFVMPPAEFKDSLVKGLLGTVGVLAAIGFGGLFLLQKQSSQ